MTRRVLMNERNELINENLITTEALYASTLVMLLLCPHHCRAKQKPRMSPFFVKQKCSGEAVFCFGLQFVLTMIYRGKSYTTAIYREAGIQHILIYFTTFFICSVIHNRFYTCTKFAGAVTGLQIRKHVCHFSR